MVGEHRHKKHLPHDTVIRFQIILSLGSLLLCYLSRLGNHPLAAAKVLSAGAGHGAGSWGRPGRLLGRTTEAHSTRVAVCKHKRLAIVPHFKVKLLAADHFT